MRHKAEPEQMTRLLLQKPAAYAELDENARIAISVLSEDGWSIERIGLDMRVQVTATPLIQNDDTMAQIAATLHDTELRLDRLRAKTLRASGDQWLSAAFAFFAAWGLSTFGIAKWSAALGAVCVGLRVMHHYRFSKGAK